MTETPVEHQNHVQIPFGADVHAVLTEMAKGKPRIPTATLMCEAMRYAMDRTAADLANGDPVRLHQYLGGSPGGRIKILFNQERLDLVDALAALAFPPDGGYMVGRLAAAATRQWLDELGADRIAASIKNGDRRDPRVFAEAERHQRWPHAAAHLLAWMFLDSPRREWSWDQIGGLLPAEERWRHIGPGATEAMVEMSLQDAVAQLRLARFATIDNNRGTVILLVRRG